MGREWYLNWGTKSSKKVKATNGDGGGCVERKSTAPQVTAAAAAAATGGCMNAVLHLFDFQQFQVCLHPQDSSLNDATPLKGPEAPRNSLESITEEDDKDYSLHIHKGIQIKTNRRDTGLKLGRIEDFSSESSYSPASAKTPSLIARLMGLDILPESNTTTPRSSHSQISPHIKTPSTTTSKKTRTSYRYNDVPGPETPRSSTSTRRWSTDIVDHHRLSLQIDKENSIVKEIELSRPSCSAISTKSKDGKSYDDEVAKSPSYYARQIMKQVKETVSRRVGMDITNTINGAREHRRDEHLLSSSTNKDKKTKKISKKDRRSSSSLRSKSCDETNNKLTISKSDHQFVGETKDTSQITVVVQDKPLGSENKRLKKFDSCDSKTSLVNSMPLKSYDLIKNKDEQFVRSSTMGKRGKTMLSSELLHGTVPSLVPFKKDTHSKLLDKEGVSSHVESSKPILKNTTLGTTTTTTTTNTTTRLSRYPRQRIYERTTREEATHAPAHHGWKSHKEATSTSVIEFQYITRILKYVGIDKNTPISFIRWFLPSHPLDPSIFHTLETTHYLTSDKLNLEINRKLIFHLVDEMLADILKPYIKHHYIHNHHLNKHHQQINGFQLVKLLCSKIRSFPSVDCQTLQDIDALVEKGLPTFGGANNLISFQDDYKEIVLEIEQHILNSLVQEIWCKT